MSGQILVDDETRRVKTNLGLTEVKDGERSLRQAERSLVDTNTAASLAGALCSNLWSGTGTIFLHRRFLCQNREVQHNQHFSVRGKAWKKFRHLKKPCRYPLRRGCSMLIKSFAERQSRTLKKGTSCYAFCAMKPGVAWPISVICWACRSRRHSRRCNN